MSCGFNKVDLENIINVIEVCTKRGAFLAEEMTGVGRLYDKLKASLNKCQEKVNDVCIKECVDGVCTLNCDSVCEKDGSGCPVNKDNLANTGT